MDINRIPLFEPADDRFHEVNDGWFKERFTIFDGQLDVIVAFRDIVIPILMSVLRFNIGCGHSSILPYPRHSSLRTSAGCSGGTS